MNTKTTLLVAIVAIIVAVYLFFVEKPWIKEEPKEPQSVVRNLFTDGEDKEEADKDVTGIPPRLLKSDEIDRIEITLKNSKRLFRKEKEQTEDKWKMIEPIECPATGYQITSIINQIKDFKYVKYFEKDDAERPDDNLSGLNKPIASVKLSKGDQLQVEFIVGSRLPTGTGNYVKLGDSDIIFVSEKDLSKEFTKRVENYRDKSVTSAKIEDVQRFKVEGLCNYELVKSGNDWVIESPIRGRADKTKAENVIRSLARLYVTEWKDDNPSSLRPYGLDKPVIKVTMETTREIPPKAKPGDPDTKPADTQPSTESKTYVLLVGGAITTKADSYFAKLDSAPWVFSIAQHVYKSLSTPVSEIRDNTLATIDQSKVSKIEAQTPGGVVTISKNKNNKWAFEDGTLADQAAVTDLMGAVEGLKATGYTDPAEQLIALDWSKPRAKISLTQKGELNPVSILVGPPTPSGKMVYVRNAAEEAVATVREDDVAQLIASPVAYQSRDVMKFSRDKAERIEITSTDYGRVELSKKDNKWSMTAPVNAEAESGVVRNLLQDLS